MCTHTHINKMPKIVCWGECEKMKRASGQKAASHKTKQSEVHYLSYSKY